MLKRRFARSFRHVPLVPLVALALCLGVYFAASAPSAAAGSGTVAKSTTARPAAVPACAPSVFTMPNAIDLQDMPTGLNIQTDTPQYYQIYGNTANDIVGQIRTCAPGANGSASAEFTAQTAYNLNWTYSISSSDAGCNISNVKVGLRIVMSLPSWQPGSATTPGLTGRWNNFMSNLLTHEQGHANIDTYYANKIVTDLSSIANVPCGGIVASAKNITNNDVTTLSAANDAYDASTNHGASQGAILPAY